MNGKCGIVRQVRNALQYLAATSCLMAWANTSYADARERAAATQTEKAELSKQLWDWYGQASELHDAGKLSEAWALYQRVWKYRKTYDVATSLGGVCYQRGEYAAAAHYYRIALDEMVPTESPKFVAEVKGAFDAARAEVTELKISIASVNGVAPVNDSELEAVTITDERSNLELQPPYYLEPGELTLRARTPGRDAVTIDVVAKPGATLKWQLDFGDSESGAAELSEDHGRTTTVRHPWIVLPIGGLATAGLAYGAWHNAASSTDAYDATVSLQLKPGDCDGNPTNAPCERATQLRQRARDAETRALWFGGGAVLAAAATGIVYWLWETEAPVSVGFDPVTNFGEVRWTHDF